MRKAVIYARVSSTSDRQSTGSVMSEAQLLSKYSEVAKRLRNGISVRDTTKLCDVSPSTVQRVKKIIDK